jgi:hypothetical protein
MNAMDVYYTYIMHTSSVVQKQRSNPQGSVIHYSESHRTRRTRVSKTTNQGQHDVPNVEIQSGQNPNTCHSIHKQTHEFTLWITNSEYYSMCCSPRVTRRVIVTASPCLSPGPLKSLANHNLCGSPFERHSLQQSYINVHPSASITSAAPPPTVIFTVAIIRTTCVKKSTSLQDVFVSEIQFPIRDLNAHPGQTNQHDPTIASTPIVH